MQVQLKWLIGSEKLTMNEREKKNELNEGSARCF